MALFQKFSHRNFLKDLFEIWLKFDDVFRGGLMQDCSVSIADSLDIMYSSLTHRFIIIQWDVLAWEPW